jgi:hypothetical protein
LISDVTQGTHYTQPHQTRSLGVASSFRETLPNAWRAMIGVTASQATWVGHPWRIRWSSPCRCRTLRQAYPGHRNLTSHDRACSQGLGGPAASCSSGNDNPKPRRVAHHGGAGGDRAHAWRRPEWATTSPVAVVTGRWSLARAASDGLRGNHRIGQANPPLAKDTSRPTCSFAWDGCWQPSRKGCKGGH